MMPATRAEVRSEVGVGPRSPFRQKSREMPVRRSRPRLVCRWHGVMLVRDTPFAVDVPQSNCQPEEEPAFLRRAAERAGATPHDGDGESDIFAGGNCKLLYVKRL